MEKNKSRFVLRTVFIFSALCLFAVQAFAGDFSDYEKKLLSEIYDMRARSRQEKDYLASQAFLEEYHKKIWSDDVQSKIGDRASDHSPEACARIARGLKAGIDLFFSAE